MIETEEEAIQKNWIKSSMFIELLAVNKEHTEKVLTDHIEKLEKEKNIFLYKKRFGDTKKTEFRIKSDKKINGYSQIVEVKLFAKTFEDLLIIVIKYGPSSIEIFGPNKIQLDMRQAQGISNTIADLIHKFAQIGIGGILVTQR